MTTYLLERAFVDGAVHDDVTVTVTDGRFADVSLAGAGEVDERIAGLTLPGFANTHSHAFHRALRGRTQRERGSFWTWREQMYAAASRLDPDSYHQLAAAAYREMVAAGFSTVGEFHYLHHQPDGRPYANPHAMAEAVVAAAGEAGIRITLLDTCYLSGGFGAPPVGVQLRYADASVHAWADRAAGLIAPGDGVRYGAAIHSVRAVPAEALGEVARWARTAWATLSGLIGPAPLHVHLSEQVAENDACLARHGCTPTRLLADHGVLDTMTSVVHATHLTADDVGLLGDAEVVAALCPTTERDLGDGVGPSRALHAAGCGISLGTDSHAVVDPFEEMRALEMDERLVTQARGHWTAAEALRAATRHDSLGFADAGAIAVGRRADLVTIDLASPRTAGTGGDENTAVFAATAADVVLTMVDGHLRYRRSDSDDVGRELDRAIRRIWP